MSAAGHFSVSTTTPVKSKGCTTSVSLCCTMLDAMTHRWGAAWGSDLISHTHTPKKHFLNVICLPLGIFCSGSHCLQPCSTATQGRLRSNIHGYMMLFHLIPSVTAVICEESWLYKEQCIVVCGTGYRTNWEGNWNERENSLSTLLEWKCIRAWYTVTLMCLQSEQARWMMFSKELWVTVYWTYNTVPVHTVQIQYKSF